MAFCLLIFIKYDRHDFIHEFIELKVINNGLLESRIVLLKIKFNQILKVLIGFYTRNHMSLIYHG